MLVPFPSFPVIEACLASCSEFFIQGFAGGLMRGLGTISQSSVPSVFPQPLGIGFT